MKVVNIEINKIKQHEAISTEHMKKIKEEISKAGIFSEPIIIDEKSLVVLDGHHRLNSCRQLGLKRIPCLLVKYLEDVRIKVKTRRQNILINKDIVVKMGLSGHVFPYKTTKHLIPGRVKNLKIPLEELIC